MPDTKSAVLPLMPLLTIPLAISVGQISFKLASRTTGLIRSNDLLSFITNPFMAFALVVYFGSTLWWIVVLKSVPLSRAYSFMALSFLYVPILSWLVFKEPISLRTMLGVAIIICGISLVATSGNAR